MKKAILSVLLVLGLALFIMGCSKDEKLVSVDSLAEGGASEADLLAAEDAEAALGDDEALVAEGSGAIAGQAVKAGTRKKVTVLSESCVDSDGGENKDVAGVIQRDVKLSNGRTQTSWITDRYYSDGRFFERYCAGTRFRSRETFCESGASEVDVNGRRAWQCNAIPVEEIVAVDQVAPGIAATLTAANIAFTGGVNLTMSAGQVYTVGLHPVNLWEVPGKANFWITRPERRASTNTGPLGVGESYGPSSQFYEDAMLGGTQLTVTVDGIDAAAGTASIRVSELNPHPEGDVPRGSLFVFSVNRGETVNFHLTNVAESLSLTYQRRDVREGGRQVAIVNVMGAERELEPGMQLDVQTASGIVSLFSVEIYEERLLFRGARVGR